MLALSSVARQTLIAPNGPIDRLLAGELPCSLDIVKRAFRTWSLDKFAFPNAIAQRGMADQQKLPHYPYRDDGKLVWDTIHQFVTDYLSLHYQTPDRLHQDRDIQDWTKKLNLVLSLDDCDGKGMPTQIDTLEQLIEIVTAIIFTCGPQHAAVNFAQDEYMTFVPNMPFASYHEFEGAKEFDQKDFMQFLPPAQQAAGQFSIAYVLSSFRYDKLGNYDRLFFEAFEGEMDEKVHSLVTEFQQQLHLVELEIERRNQSRVVPYNYLKPSLIPNSISI